MWLYRGFLFVVLSYHSVATNIVNDESFNKYELLGDEQLLADTMIYNNPIALLIDDSYQNFKNVLEVLQRGYFNDSDLWLVTFNNSGVSTIWEKSFSNIKQFYSTLNSLTTQKSPGSIRNQSLPIFALYHTAKALPKESAVIIFSNAYMNEDKELENNALNLILSKNITVYTVNEPEETSNGILQNIRTYSGGKKLIVNQKPKFEDYRYHSYPIPSNVSVILSKKFLRNTSDVSFPVDSAISAIHITIRPSTTTKGVLTSPTGYIFSFSNRTKSNAIKYSQGSIFENYEGYFEMHLNLSTSTRPTVGIWTLHLENTQNAYNVTVFAFSNIATDHFSESDIPEDVMKLGVTGKISHITDVSLLDSNGETVLGNISYQFNNSQLTYVTRNSDNVPDIKNTAVIVDINSKLRLAKPFYALIKGKDVKGNAFQRLSYIFGRSDIYPTQTITVQVGLGSQLIVASGKRAEIYFEVTNLGTSAQLVTFTCSDHRYILHSLSSYRTYLEPQQSTISTLYINTRTGTYQDEITFSVKTGSQLIQKKIIVDVGAQIVDQKPPELSHLYTSDCTEVLFSECSKGTWTIEITARDVDSGLLQVNTRPKGLYLPYGYTAGTKDSVSGHYSDSCCNPDLHISAVDRLNNRNSYSVNAYKTIFSPGLIAAIVLGVLLLIILISAVTVVSIKKFKKKESYDLPTYRGGGI